MDDKFREKLDLDELYKKKKNTHDHKIKIYNKILARVHKKIKTTARMRNNENFCYFLLPEFVLGIPRYDIGSCNSYIIEKLRNNGFNIKYTHPNLLFISWNHYIPKYERLEYKKKTGNTIDGFGNVIKKKSENKNSKQIIENNNSSIKKSNSNFKNTQNYKPSGNLIYNSKFLKDISDSINK
jgi:hypothetical protein